MDRYRSRSRERRYSPRSEYDERRQLRSRERYYERRSRSRDDRRELRTVGVHREVAAAYGVQHEAALSGSRRRVQLDDGWRLGDDERLLLGREGVGEHLHAAPARRADARV